MRVLSGFGAQKKWLRSDGNCDKIEKRTKHVIAIDGK